MAASLTLFLLPLFLSPFTSTATSAVCDGAVVSDHHSTLQILHINSPCSPFRPSQPLSWEETVHESQSKDHARFQFLSSHIAGRSIARRSIAPISSGQILNTSNYLVRVNVGTPPQAFLMAVDTSNDAAWVPCSGCTGCSSAVFSSEKSSSFSPVPCNAVQCNQVPNGACNSGSCGFNTTYGGSTLTASLSKDTFRLAADNIPGYTFGCIKSVTGASFPPQGLLGLGRGPLSLLSQTQRLYQSTFSYCLPSYKALNFSGSLILGPVAQPKRINYTPLLRNPRRSSLYYVNLLSIKVDNKILAIPSSAFAFNAATGAGTIVDSGTVYTRLVKAAYEAVKTEFRQRMGTAPVTTLGGFDTCYTVPITISSITFMFAGANVTLPQDNFLIRSSSSSTTCLAMAAAPDNVNSVLNVIASFQQQNHRYLFDVPNSRLGISRETCS